jgi:hypothetical protein
MGQIMRKQFANFVEFSVDEMHHISQKKFEETGSIMDSKLPVCHRTGRSFDSFAAVSESVAESPLTSLRHRSRQLDIPRSTMQ